ncbi:MAG: hypothetical protein WDW38_009839 [Sanguina aurantia]
MRPAPLCLPAAGRGHAVGPAGDQRWRAKFSRCGALAASSQKTTCVVRRTGAAVPMQSPRDRYYHHLMDGQTADCPAEPVDAEHPLFILYTSGSTGKPKGVLHTTGGYLVYASYTHEAAASTHPDTGRFWDVIDKHKVTLFYTAPTAIRALMREPAKLHQKTSTPALRLLGRGRRADQSRSTETGGILITPLAGAIDAKPGSATLPFFGIKPAIVDANGEVQQDHAAGMASRVEPLPPNFPALIRAESGGGVSLVWHDGDGGRTEQDAHHRTRPHPKARGGGGDSGRAETAAQLTHAPRSSLSPRLPDGGMRSGQPVTKDGVRRLPPCGAGRHASRVEPLPPNFPALIRAESGGGVSLVWHDGDGGRTEQDAHHRTRPHPKARGGGGDSGRAETAAQLTHAPRSSLSPRLPDGGMRSGQPVTKDGVQRLPPCGAGRHASRVEPLPPNFPALIRAESGGGVSLVWHDGDGGRTEQDAHHRTRPHPKARGGGGDSGRAETAAQLTHAPRSSLSPRLPDRGMRSGQPVTKDGVRRLPPCGAGRHASRVEPLPPNFPALIRAESGGGVSLVWHDGDGRSKMHTTGLAHTQRQEGVGGDSGRAETAAQLTHAPRSSLSPRLPDRGMRSGQPVTKDGVQRLPPCGAGRHASRVEPLPPNFPALIRAESGGGVSLVWHDGDGRSKMHTTGLAHTQRQEGVGGDSGRAETAAQLTHAPRSSLSPQLPDRGMRSGQPVTKDGVQRLPPCGAGRHASRVEPLPPNFPALIRAESGGGVSLVWHDGDGRSKMHTTGLAHTQRQEGVGGDSGRAETAAQLTHAPRSSLSPQLPDRGMRSGQPVTKDGVQRLPPPGPGGTQEGVGGDSGRAETAAQLTHAPRSSLSPQLPDRGMRSGQPVTKDGVQRLPPAGPGGTQEGVGGDSGRAETAAQLTHAPRSSLSPQLPDRGMRSGQPVTKDGVQRLPPCGAGRHASRVEPLPPNFPALIRAESGGGVSLVWHDGDGRSKMHTTTGLAHTQRQEGVGGDSGRAETAAQLTHAPRSSLSPQLPDRGMRSGQPVTKDGVQRLPPRGAGRHASRVEPLPPNFPALIRAESGGGVSLVWHDGDGRSKMHTTGLAHTQRQEGVGGDSGRAETAAQLTHAPRSSLSPQLPDRGMRSGQPVTKDGVQRLPPCGAGRHASRVEPLPPNFPALIRAESGGGVSLVWHDGDGRSKMHTTGLAHTQRQEGVGGDSGRAETAAQLTHAPRSSLSPQLPDRGMRSGQPVTKDGVQRLPPLRGRAARRSKMHTTGLAHTQRQEGVGGDSGRAETAAQLTHAPRSSLSPQLPDRGMRSGQPVTKDGVQRLPPCGAGRHASRVEPLPPNFPALIRAESGGGVSLVWHDGDGGRTEQDAHHRTRPHPKARGGGGDSGRAETAAQLTHAPRSSLSPQLPDRGMRSGQPVTKDGVPTPALRGRAARHKDNVEDGCDC